MHMSMILPQVGKKKELFDCCYLPLFSLKTCIQVPYSHILNASRAVKWMLLVNSVISSCANFDAQFLSLITSVPQIN